jgi:hypothetical protein
MNARIREWATHEYFPIAVLVLVSTIVNLLLVFKGSIYWTYLDSDMGGYWSRAMTIFNGTPKEPDTWVANAPFYPRVIARVFTWMNYFHLNDHFLRGMLTLNVLASSLGTLSLYFIGRHITKHHVASLILAGVYAFAYPNMYYNVFLLGEPFAVPLIIFSIWLLFHFQHSYRVFLAGLVLAFAVGVRPSNGLLGLPFALYLLFAGLAFSKRRSLRDWIDIAMPRIGRAAVFSLAFFVVIFSMVAENARISDHQLRGMTAHTGYNFFLGQTQGHKIVAQYDGITYGFVPSSVAGHPEYGSITSPIPIYESDQYFAEGWKVLKANPHLWLDHFKKYKYLFFDNLFPGTPSVFGFDLLFDPFRYLLFYMLVFSGLLYIAFREKDIRNADVIFFGSIFGLSCAALFFFTVTFQYFLNFSYSVYVLFFMAAFSAFKHFRKYKTFILGYTAAVIVCAGAYYLYQGLHPHFVDEKVKITLSHNEEEIGALSQPPKIVSTKTLYVNNLEFLEAEPLEHGTMGRFDDYFNNFYLSAETDVEVLEDGPYMFTVYADDGYRLLIDGKHLMGHDGLKTMDEFQIRENTYLNKGKHSLKIDMFQGCCLSGLVVYYKRLDYTKPPVTPYDNLTRRGQGKFVGDDDEFTKFSAPR